MAHSAARRPGSRPLAGPSGSSSSAQREQVIGERLERALALAAELEARERPRELVAVGRAARDEVAEGAQLVLLLGGHDQHPVRAAARAERQRSPFAPADPSPRERAERHAAVAEQPQRAQQVLQDLAAAGDRLSRVVFSGGERDDQVLGAAGLSAGERSLGQTLEDVRLDDRQAGCERELARADREPVQGGDERRLSGAGERRALQARERGAQPLGTQLEVGLFVEHLRQQREDRRTDARARVRSRRLRVHVREIPVEAVEALEQPRGVAVARQALQLGAAFGDELAGQRAVAVQRRGARTSARSLRLELERHLRAGRERRAQLARSRLDELGQRRLELE